MVAQARTLWSPIAIFLMFSATSSVAQIQVRVSKQSIEDSSQAVMVVRSEAQGTVSFALSGLGTIRSNRLATGASETYTYSKSGILQYRVGKGNDQVRDVVSVSLGQATELVLTGHGLAPAPLPSAPVTAPEPQIAYRPEVDTQFRFKNPYGPAFEKLSTEEKIRMVNTSPDSGKLAAPERDRLLGFLLNQRGVEEANGGRYSQAETSLLESRRYLPDAAGVNMNLAFVKAAGANEKRKAGYLDQSESGFYQALDILLSTPNPELESQIRSALASLLVEQASHLGATQQSRRKALYQKALDQDPQQPRALFEMGQMAYADYDLEQALQFFEQAYRVAPQQGLADLIQKVRAEIQEAGDFVTEDRGSFKISFEGREVKEIARETRRLLADAEREVGKKLGHRPSSAIPVVIYSGGQFQQILGLHAWAGGAYDGKIRLPIGDLSERDFESGKERIRQLVFHEYAHALLHDKAPSVPLPIWFHEGLAQLVAGEDPGSPRSYGQMVNAVLSGLIPPPSEMSAGFSSVADANTARMLYLASYSFISHLIEEKGGWSRVRKTLDQVAGGNGLESAMENVYKRTLQELEDDWIQHLNR